MCISKELINPPYAVSLNVEITSARLTEDKGRRATRLLQISFNKHSVVYPLVSSRRKLELGMTMNFLLALSITAQGYFCLEHYRTSTDH